MEKSYNKTKKIVILPITKEKGKKIKKKKEKGTKNKEQGTRNKEKEINK